MAVVNVFLNAPQTQILDVNEKTSIIDAVRDDDEKNADANYLKRSEQYGCSKNADAKQDDNRNYSDMLTT